MIEVSGQVNYEGSRTKCSHPNGDYALTGLKKIISMEMGHGVLQVW